MSSYLSPDPKTPPRNQQGVPTHQRTGSQSISYQPHANLAFDFTIGSDPDPNSPLTPTSFSPSKARQQAQATHQQTQLVSWLETLIPQTHAAHALLTRWLTAQSRLGVTNPELAGEVIAWLQMVMYTVQAADERRRLQFEAAREEKDRLQAWRAGDGAEHIARVLEGIYSSLTPQGREAVDALAASAVLLGRIPDAGAVLSFTATDERVSQSSPAETLMSELGAAVMAHTIDMQDTRATITELEILHGNLRRQLDRMRLQMSNFQREKFVADADAETMRSQTAQWNRETKQILIKIKEYKDRVAALERSRPVNRLDSRSGEQTIMAEDVAHLQERVDEKREVVRRLEQKVNALNGLPPNLEASRNEVKRAKGELQRLKERREELFGILAQRK